MLSNTAQKFAGGCFLLVRRKENTVIFLGTAFLIHEEGYLLTAAHLIEEDRENLMVARAQEPDDFTTISLDNVSAMAVSVEGVDAIHNAALLKLAAKRFIETPDHLAGVVENTALGAPLVCLGFPFGHQDIHSLAVLGAHLSAKILSKNTTKLILFDSMIHDGMSGGPLVSNEDGRVVGITVGRFSPLDEGGDFTRGTEHPDYHTNLSYAISIEYGLKLLEGRGLTVY